MLCSIFRRPLPLLRPRHPDGVRGGQGRRQRALLRDRRGGAVGVLPQPVHLGVAAARPRRPPQAGLRHGALRDLPLLQAARHQGPRRAHRHDRPQEVGDVPGRHLPGDRRAHALAHR